MSQPLPSPRLQEIRDTDTAAGEDLQMCPQAWQHRRELLGHITVMEENVAIERRLTLELSTMLEPFSAGAMSLEELVARMRMAAQMRQAMTPMPQPPSTCGYCSYEEADGELLEQCAKCKAKDAQT